MKILVSTPFGEHYEELKCCICGEEDRDKLQVESLGIGAGMSGEDYCFCYKCWNSKTLGKEILKLIGYPEKLKLIGEAVPCDTKEDTNVR